ncbi:MAG: chemotaxis-specific protein-glutamate methyltransferase CheB [Bacteroidota bacterium]
MINLLLVDDSSFMRLVLADMLESSSQIKVIATAENGKEAHEKTLSYKPDVVLLDLIMKDYDGLYAVKQIMSHCPTPIIILSSLGNTNTAAVFEAIEAGAYDFMNKPYSEMSARIRDLEAPLLAKIRQASVADRSRLLQHKASRNSNPHTFDSHLSYDILAIGASTGGTGAIEEILKRLPSNFPIPIVIAQHMPADYVPLFAKRLDDMLPLTVKVIQQGEKLRKGTVYIAPGNQNTQLVSEGTKDSVRLDFTDNKFQEFNHPSVDCLMHSVAEVYGNRAIAIILTGMGKDGTTGMKAIFQKKALTIAQNEKTCVVFGMPKSAIEKGAIQHVLPLQEIPGFVVSCLS